MARPVKPTEKYRFLTTWRFLGATAALAILVGGAMAVRDEVRLESIRVGMPELEVRARLGKASEEVQAPLPAYVVGLACRDTSLPRCGIYSRRFKTSLFVFYDRGGHVACVERGMYLRGGVWKTASRVATQ